MGKMEQKYHDEIERYHRIQQKRAEVFEEAQAVKSISYQTY